ncbi:MAG: hypothetical protein Q9179_000182 [Wetmoreana sp. 5 TL-2023]
MPSYTPVQKSAIQQFTAVTDAKDSVAAKTLKNNNWNIDQAINAHFNSNSSTSNPSPTTQSLNKLFDKYRDNASEEPDTIGVDGSMRYFADLGIALDEPVVLVVLTELNAPTMGELTRQGFVDGWKRLRANNITEQKSTLPSLRHSLPSSSGGLFLTTYKSTFRLALSPGQRSLPLDTAIEYWRLLLSPPSLSWNTKTTPWLDWWIEYLTTKWKKGVSKDMWVQTGVFVGKSLEDEGMGWWSEDGAWPGVLDEFVGFVRGKRGVDGGDGEAEEMET